MYMIPFGVPFIVSSAGAAVTVEWVPVSEPVEPGDVLELDPENSGCYRRARQPCSTSVAGVVFTISGFVPGSSPATNRPLQTTHHVLPTTHYPSATDSTLLALFGIVPVKVTDESGPIHPGDLLMASSTPGYAMRWDRNSGEPCAFVGKALGPLEGEKGVLPVLLVP